MLLSSIESTTTYTYGLASFKLNNSPVRAFIAGLAGFPPCTGTATCVVISVKTQFSDHCRIRFTSQLDIGISSVHEELLKYFHDTANNIFMVLRILHLLCCYSRYHYLVFSL